MSLKIVRMNLSKKQNLTYNFVLDLIYRTFELKSSWKLDFWGQNNPQTTSEQIQINFQKVQNNDFLGHKNDQITGNNFGKCVNILFFLDLGT